MESAGGTVTSESEGANKGAKIRFSMKMSHAQDFESTRQEVAVQRTQQALRNQ